MSVKTDADLAVVASTGADSIPSYLMLADTSATNATGIGQGDVRWNNATQASASTIYIYGTDSNGNNNQSRNLEYPTVGDILNIRVKDDSSIYQKWEIASITNNTTYTTYGVILVSDNGGNISNSSEVVIGFDLTISAYEIEQVGTGFIGGEKTTDAGGALNSLGTDSISIISGASAASMVARGLRSIVIGHDSYTSTDGESSVVLGDTNYSLGKADVVIGLSSNSSNTGNGYNCVIGSESVATSSASFSISLGYSSETSNQGSISIGAHAHSSGLNSIRVGSASGTKDSAGDYSVVIGYGSSTSAGGDYCVIIGKSITGNGLDNIQLGNGASTPAGGDYNIIAGTSSTLSGTFNNCIVLGQNASGGGNNSICIGESAITSAANTAQFGNGTNSTANTAQFSSMTIVTDASSTTRAYLRLPHGSAPTSPVDGDIWTTTAGLYVRINGSTVGPLS